MMIRDDQKALIQGHYPVSGYYVKHIGKPILEVVYSSQDNEIISLVNLV